MPIFNNDAIRTEVIENLGTFDLKEYIKLRNLRLKEVIGKSLSFIGDASVDREWPEVKKQLVANNYQWFIISLDLSRTLLVRLYQAKEYFHSLKRIDELMRDHDVFLSEYPADASLHISGSDFKNRCQICYDKTAEWIKNIA